MQIDLFWHNYGPIDGISCKRLWKPSIGGPIKPEECEEIWGWLLTPDQELMACLLTAASAVRHQLVRRSASSASAHFLTLLVFIFLKEKWHFLLIFLNQQIKNGKIMKENARPKECPGDGLWTRFPLFSFKSEPGLEALCWLTNLLKESGNLSRPLIKRRKQGSSVLFFYIWARSILVFFSFY